MDEIFIARSEPTTMNLDEDEQRLLEEIQVRRPKMKQIPRPTGNKFRQQSQSQRRNYEEAPEDINAFMNPTKQQPSRAEEAREEVNQDYGDGDGDGDGDGYGYGNGNGNGNGDMGMDGDVQEEKPANGYFSINDEKADLLNKLTRLEKKGFAINKRLNAYSDIQEMRSEYKRIMYGIEVEQSIKFSRRMLVACTTGLEFLNRRYNPFELQLEGWSESIMENIDDYDGVFEELYAKYRTKMHVAPEVKLLMMMGGSAMMFHLTNSMFKAAIPNVNDILKQNPGLAQSMMNAVKNTVPRGQSQQKQDGEYEMSGPGIDLSQLMGSLGGFSMPPPPPVSSTVISKPDIPERDDDQVSDIVSVAEGSDNGEESQVKEVRVSGTAAKGKRGRKSKKNEINL